MAQDPVFAPTPGSPQRTIYDELLALLPEEPTVMGGIGEAASRVGAGVAGVAGSLLKLPATAGKMVGFENAGLEGLADVGERVEGAFGEPDPAYSGGWTGFLTQDVPAGVGSGLAFLGAAFATGGGGAVAGLIGAATAYVSGYEEMAARDDVDETTRWIYALGQGAMGYSERVPVGRLLARLNSRTGGGVRKVLWDMAAQAFEEGGQEAAQQAWGNFLRVSLTPDEWRSLGAELRDVGYAGAVGAAAGGLIGGGASLASGALDRIAAEQEFQGPTVPRGTPAPLEIDQEAAAPAFAKLRAALTGKGMPPEQVEAILATAQRAPDLPATRLGAQVLQVSGPQGAPLGFEGYEEQGTILLDASLDPQTRRAQVLAHELYGHYTREAAPDEWLQARETLERDHPDLMDRWRVAQVEKRQAAGLPIKTEDLAREESVANAAEEVPAFIEWVITNPEAAAELLADRKRYAGRRPFMQRVIDLLVKAARLMGASMRTVSERLEALGREVASTEFEKADPGRALEIAQQFAMLADQIATRNLRPVPRAVPAAAEAGAPAATPAGGVVDGGEVAQAAEVGARGEQLTQVQSEQAVTATEQEPDWEANKQAGRAAIDRWRAQLRRSAALHYQPATPAQAKRARQTANSLLRAAAEAEARGDATAARQAEQQAMRVPNLQPADARRVAAELRRRGRVGEARHMETQIPVEGTRAAQTRRQERRAGDPAVEADDQGDRFSPATGWHGSPADFDRFDHKHILSGEGNLAYGWGSYIGGQREVAEHYRRTAPTFTLGGQSWADLQRDLYSHPRHERRAIGVLGETNGDAAAAERALRESGFPDSVAAADAVAAWADAGLIRKGGDGHLYKVRLAPEEDEYLLWDEPLPRQSAKVRAALDALAVSDKHDTTGWTATRNTAYGSRDWSVRDADGALVNSLLISPSIRTAAAAIKVAARMRWPGLSQADLRRAQRYPDGYKGGWLYHAIAGGYSTAQMRSASEALLAAGVRGIKYLDGLSRADGRGTHNYVLFDAGDIEITDRFSVPEGPKGGPWFSAVEQAIENIKQEKLSRLQLQAALSKAPGVTKEELDYLGLDDWMREKPSVTKADALQFVREHRIIVDEAMDSPEFLAMTLQGAAAMAPGNVVVYHNSGHEDVVAGAPAAIPGAVLSSEWSRSKKASSAEYVGVFDQKSQMPQATGKPIPRAAKKPAPPAPAAEAAPEPAQEPVATPPPAAPPATPQQPAPPPPAPTFNAKDESLLEAVERAVLQRLNPLDRTQRDIAAAKRTVTEAQDAALAAKLFPGKRSDRVREGEILARRLAALMKLAGLDLATLDDYLRALHAPQRNALMAKRHPVAFDPAVSPGSGRDSKGVPLTDAHAAEIVREVESSPKAAQYQKARDIVREAYDLALQMRVEANLLSKSGAATWRQQFGEHFVSLRDEEVDEDGVPWFMKPAGFQMPAKLTRRAEGRKSTSGSPTAWAFEQFTAIALQAAKNDVMRTLAEQVRAHPNPALWAIRTKPSTGDELGADAAEVRFYEAEEARFPGDERRYLHLRGPNGLLLAQALKNMGGLDANVIARILGPISRTFTALVTRLNPEFALRNLAKDVQTAAARVGATLSAADAAKMPISALAAMRAARRVLSAERRGETGPSGHWEDLFRRWRAAGGQTGWLEHIGYEERVRSFEEMRRDGAVVDAMRTVASAFLDLQDSIEAGTRLAAFDAGLRSGLTEAKAAAFSRDVTVDFNRRGELTAGINALYWFFNPSVQGTRMVMKTVASPKGAAIASALVALSYAMARYNHWIGGGDDEPHNRADEMSPWQRNAYLTLLLPESFSVPLPGGGSYEVDRLTVPIGWGYNVFWALGQQLERMVSKRSDMSGALAAVAGATFEAFSPMGSTPTFGQFVSPSLVDPIVQVSENVSWSGSPIMPEGYGQRPDSHLAWPTTSQALQTAMRQINEWTGGSSRRSGAVDISPETIEYLVRSYTGGVGSFAANVVNTAAAVHEGGPLPSSNVPILRSFVGAPNPRAVAGLYREALRDVQATEGELRDREPPKHPELLRLAGAAKAYDKRIRALRDAGRDEDVLATQREFLALYRQARALAP